MDYSISANTQCKKCVLDTTVPNISFDDEGICNFCHYYDHMAEMVVNKSDDFKKKELERRINHIKSAGKKNQYDCILGVSGGVDSTYLALLVKKYGLRPLVVHFDNGWNSELAVSNIENIVTKLGYDLHTFVMDWEEFRDIQLSYFRASVVDIEVPTDQFIFGALNKIAKQYGIKYILSGHNIVTEAINPDGWVYKHKFDLRNLKQIHKRFGSVKLKNLPRFGIYHQYYYQTILGIKTVGLLDYIPYNKKEVKQKISDELGWRDYGGKHYESLFTRFYQGYVLPRKFNVDKRKSHQANLIMSGQVSREEALLELQGPTYPLDEQESDREYVIKKLGISEEEFDKIMSEKPKPHAFYGTDRDNWFKALFMAFRIAAYVPVRFLRFIGVLYKPML